MSLHVLGRDPGPPLITHQCLSACGGILNQLPAHPLSSRPIAASDVTVYFDQAAKHTLLKLNTGDVVTYRGLTSKLGKWMSNHKLVGRKIVALQFGQAQVFVR